MDEVLPDATDRKIARLVLQGETNAAIARRLGMPLGSVKWRLHRLYRKLQVDSRIQFAMRLRDLGIRL